MFLCCLYNFNICCNANLEVGCLIGTFVGTIVVVETIGLVETLTGLRVLIITFFGSFRVGLGGPWTKPYFYRPYLFWETGLKYKILST